MWAVPQSPNKLTPVAQGQAEGAWVWLAPLQRFLACPGDHGEDASGCASEQLAMVPQKLTAKTVSPRAQSSLPLSTDTTRSR